MEQYDVVIVGAGPAGLFMAKELSKDFSVCVIEKKKIGETSKFWVVSNKNVSDNDLEDCVISRPHICVFRDYTGKEVGGKISKGNPILEEHKVLKKWAGEAKKNGAKIYEKTLFKKFTYQQKDILVYSGNHKLSARLLIDASGASSKIAEKNHALKEIGYHCTYGGLFKNMKIQNPDKIVMWDYIKKSKPVKLWLIYPVSKSEGYTIIYLTSKKKIPLSNIKKDFEYYIKNVSYLPKMMKNAELIEPKFGYIPLYERKKRAIDNVLFLGDAAGLDPPCFGGGVYTILSLYKNFIVKIKEKLKKDKLDARSLQQCTELSEEYKDNFLFQEILSYIMRDSKREELALHSLDIIAKRFTSKQEAEILFSQADPKLLVQMISSMVSVFTLEELFELIPKERIPLFIELCAKLVKDFAVEEAYVLFHKKYPS